MISFLIPTHIGYHHDTLRHLGTLVNSIPTGVPGVEVFLIGNILQDEGGQVYVDDYECCDKLNLIFQDRWNGTSFEKHTFPLTCTGPITEKFNLGVKYAKNDYVVWCRDYMKFDHNWFNHMVWDFDVCMNRIVNQDRSRFRDWCSWDDPKIRPEPWIQKEKWCESGKFWPAKAALAPYSYNKTDKMYVSGGYLIGRRKFLLENPMNESLDLGEAEDVEWSIRVRDKWKYVMNQNQVVYLQKQKDVILPNYENGHLYFRNS